MEDWMATSIAPEVDILEVWKRYKLEPDNIDLRNHLIEQYMPLVRYNGDRIWQRLPDGDPRRGGDGATHGRFRSVGPVRLRAALRQLARATG